MAYRELVAQRNSTLTRRVEEPALRFHYWDAQGFDQRGWPWSLIALFVFVLAAMAAVLFFILSAWGGSYLIEPVSFDDFFGEDGTQPFRRTFGIPSSVPDAMFVFASVAVVLPAVWLVARLVQGWRFGDISSVVGRFRWKLFWAALALGSCVILALGVVDLAMSVTIDGNSFQWRGFSDDWWLALVMVVPLIALQSSAEEFVVRGWLPMTLHRFLPNTLFAAVISTVLFSALHWGNEDVSTSPLLAMGSFAILSFWLSWLSLRFGGIEVACGLHTANNMLIMMLADPQEVGLADFSLWTFQMAGNNDAVPSA